MPCPFAATCMVKLQRQLLNGCPMNVRCTLLCNHTGDMAPYCWDCDHFMKDACVTWYFHDSSSLQTERHCNILLQLCTTVVNGSHTIHRT